MHLRAQQIVVAADDDALRGGLGGDDIKRLAGGDAQSAALADGEVMDAGMLADNLAIGGDQLAGEIPARDALLVEIGVDEGGVIAIGDEANFLAIGLVGGGDVEARGRARAPPASACRREGTELRAS